MTFEIEASATGEKWLGTAFGSEVLGVETLLNLTEFAACLQILICSFKVVIIINRKISQILKLA